MTDNLPDTPNLSKDWCPGCEPERDPSREILSVRHCHRHHVNADGLDDEEVRQLGLGRGLSGSSEAGEDGKAWCDVIHRGIRGEDEGSP